MTWFLLIYLAIGVFLVWRHWGEINEVRNARGTKPYQHWIAVVAVILLWWACALLSIRDWLWEKIRK